MSFKIGFHTGIDGNIEGLDEWMASLDAAGIPIFLKSVDDAEPLYKAQLLGKASGVPHNLVFRRSTGKISDANYDVPNYSFEPKDAAQAHWHSPPALAREPRRSLSHRQEAHRPLSRSRP